MLREEKLLNKGDKSTANDYNGDNNVTTAWDKHDLKKDVRTKSQENIANSLWRNILFAYTNIQDIKDNKKR